MKLKFTVELDVMHLNGPHVSREALLEEAKNELSNNMPSELAVSDSNYEVTDSNVEEAPA